MIKVTMVYTITGKNSFALSEFMDKTVANFIQEHGELAVERHDASEVSADILIQASQSLPFLAEKKLVVVKQVSSNQELLDKVEELVERNDASVDVYLVDSSLDKRKSSYKKLQKLTKLTEFKQQRPEELVTWVERTVHDAGGTINRTSAKQLVDRVGDNQQVLAHEIEKLLLFDTKITKDNIENLTDESLQSNVFALLDAAFQKNSQKALELYKKQRSAQVDPNYIIAMITWQLQSLALAVYATPQRMEVLTAVGQSSFAANKALQLARHTTKDQLKTYVNELAAIDAQIKTSVIEPDAGIELFLLRLTTSS